MAGEIRGHTGWFPESYVQPVDAVAASDNAFVQQDSVEKRALELVHCNVTTINYQTSRIICYPLFVTGESRKFLKMCPTQDL